METSASHGRSDAGAGDLVAEVRTAVGNLYRRFRSERADGALGDAALDVLLYLAKSGPQTLTHLSERAGVAPASMSQSVNRLTAGGYAVRAPDPTDGRKVLLSVTPEGDRLAATNRSHRDAWLEAHLAALDTEDRDVITRACALLGGITAS